MTLTCHNDQSNTSNLIVMNQSQDAWNELHTVAYSYVPLCTVNEKAMLKS